MERLLRIHPTGYSFIINRCGSCTYDLSCKNYVRRVCNTTKNRKQAECASNVYSLKPVLIHVVTGGTLNTLKFYKKHIYTSG